MNKRKTVIIVIVLFVLAAVVFCGIFFGKKIVDMMNPGELISIDVEVAARNQSKVVHVYHPFYTYELIYGNAATGEHGGLLRKELARDIRDKEIPAKTVRRLIELVESMQQDPSSKSNQTVFDENNYAYSVQLHIRKKENTGNSVTAKGYDALPECWPEFAGIVNDIIEEDALDEAPELLKFSAEWYKKAFAIDDSDFEYGDFEDMVRSQRLGMADIIGDKYWRPMGPVERYQLKFTALGWNELDKCRAREIQVVDSTEEEFTRFVENYFDAVSNPDDSLPYEYMETDAGIRFGVISNVVETILIFRSCEWQPEETYEGTFSFIDRGGPEGMTAEYPVYYSPDGKYILATCTNQEKYFQAFGLFTEESGE